MKRPVQSRHVILGIFVVLAIVVWFTRDDQFLVSHSALRERYAPFAWLMMLHGIPAATALCLGFFQFSNRLRQRHLTWHKVMGRVYVASVFIAAPAACFVGLRLPTNPSLEPANVIQALGWLLTTATALYCVRIGKIQQHREWMIRSYPFAMVFIATRAFFAVPAFHSVPKQTVVWTCIAVAGILPSLLIEWDKLATARSVIKRKATV